MNDDLSELLRDRYPLLYSNGIMFECGDGWFVLINALSAKLELLIAACEDHPEHGRPYASQVKEKYGTLRFYMSYMTDEMEALIDEAEDLSAKTCEICGKDGEIRGNHWVQTLCEEHK